ncbi:MAG: hypothetical protein JO359_05985 [Candidatus Eremiobacteraeota bacterium]|nr:hypothetical protein [Candidatus Eremiobacteraeota bacterium]
MRILEAILAAALCADTAALPSLRHLTYDVSYRTLLTSDTANIVISPPRVRRGQSSTTVVNNAPQITSEAVDKRAERIEIDVVAVTKDGGLVVDASVEGTERKAPKARIAILRDGSLSYDPKATVLEEERRLCALLRRDGFDHELTAGAYWREPIEEKLAKGKVEYRVLRSAGSTAELEITSQVSFAGASPYDETSRTVTAYDSRLLAPQEATVRLRVRRQNAMTQVVTSDIEIHLVLAEDSFKSKN